MSELTQLERALRILQRLITHDRVTVNELFNMFDQQESIRTIQRTLDNIMSSNIPITYENGAHGTRYFSIKRAFEFLPIGLNSDEVVAAMLLAQFSDVFSGTKIAVDIQNVFKKINQLMPSNSIAISTELNNPTNIFHIHQAGKVTIGSDGNVLGNMFSAIMSKQECMVQYQRSIDSPVTKFQFHPYSLLLHSNSIYCLGYQPRHKGWIYLALQRVREVSMQNKYFTRDSEFDLDNFLKDNFGIWHEDPVDVVIRFDNVVANSIQERTWHHSQKIESSDNGSIELIMHVGPSEELMSWILKWGIHAEVLQPDSLRHRVREVFFEGLKIYNKNDNT